ncbi:CD166 antigen isoform X2 [Rhinatrema bivittatum]|uniref:CD166 antigen isoform X2 n=1 Tax=Rhinatrema bivittatum TaxID=194408 RepID=UPI00112B1523|nr:CD166 antigen isoform X2 [Rhinatrema bivittatum]
MAPATAWRVVALCLVCAAAVRRGLAMHTVNAIYGETIILPCGLDVPQSLLFGKWKFETPEGITKYVATRAVMKQTVQYDNVPEYKDRLIISENYTLSILNASITDQKKFVCVLVVEDNVFEVPTIVKMFKQPMKPEIINQASFIETGKLNMLGECIAKDSYPEGNLTWYKNGKLLKEVNEAVIITSQKDRDPASGLYTTKSSLQYLPTKDDLNAEFTCTVVYDMPGGKESSVSEPAVFDVYYPTEKVTIQILSPTKSIKEGDNITLKCIGNGNPPPQEFLFYTPGQPEGVSSSNTYTMTDVKRNATGDYKCSLTDQNMLASTTVTVHYLDLSLTPSGEVTKQVGEALPVSCAISSSKNVSVVWTKDKNKLPSSPSFASLRYEDAGNYVCETLLPADEGLKKRKAFTLIVEGKPQLKMTKKSSSDGKYKTIICIVEGYPMPVVQWTTMGGGNIVNKTEESAYVNGKFESKINISPEENVTLTCTAENKLERSVASVNVSAINIPEQDEQEDKTDENKEKVNDQAKLIVGIVVGLLLAALVAGVAYWLYMKKSKSASKHVGKELGNTEENKKLEENNHKSEA